MAGAGVSGEAGSAASGVVSGVVSGRSARGRDEPRLLDARVPSNSDLPGRVERLCAEVAPLLPASPGEVLLDAQSSLREPLRLAVVGRVKAGKSTLVNALIGRRVAPTRAGECTRVVTWYQYGAPDSAQVHLTDGSVRSLAFLDGRLPEDLGVPVEDVQRIVVRLAARRLKDLTVIDTPGLATLTARNEQATRNALLGDTQRSQEASGQAEALLFVFREAERLDEVEFLRQFRDASGDLDGSATNAIGVLSQADQFGSGDPISDDPFVVARELAHRLAEARRAEVCAVVPVSGLLAETARTGRMTAGDALALARTAAVDAARLQLWEHIGPPPDVEEEDLRRLFAMLGPWGTLEGRRHAAGGMAVLRPWLDDVSGLGALEELIRDRFLGRAQAIKAARVLAVLKRLAPDSSDPDAVRALIEEAELDPALHPLRELRALQLLHGSVPSSPLVVDIQGVMSQRTAAEKVGLPRGASAEEVARAARARARAAQADAAILFHPCEVEAARVLARTYQLLARAADHVDASSAL